MGFILFNPINWPISHTQVPGTHDITPPVPPPAWRGAVITVSAGLNVESDAGRLTGVWPCCHPQCEWESSGACVCVRERAGEGERESEREGRIESLISFL